MTGHRGSRESDSTAEHTAQYPPPPARLAALIGLLLGLISLSNASVAVVLPAVLEDLDLGAASGSWVISLYALTLAVFSALYGRLADLYGIRAPLATGVTLMGVGALLAATAPTFPVLIAGRLIQGLGAAALPPLAMTTVQALYSGSDRVNALARVTGVATATASFGPLLGGGVASLVGWRFALGLPVLGLLALIPLWRWLPSRGTGARLDLPGALLVAATTAGIVILFQSPAASWPIAWVGGPLLVIGIPTLIQHVRRRPEGFLPKRVMLNGRIVRCAFAGSAIPGVWFALMVVVPLTLASYGWALWLVGLAMVPSAVTGLVGARFTPRLLRRLGNVGCLRLTDLGAVGVMLLAAAGVVVDDVLVGAALMMLATTGITALAGLAQSGLIGEVGRSVEPDVRGVATGVATLIFMVGGALGSATVGGLTELWGIGVATLVLAAFPVGGLLLLHRLPRDPAVVLG